MDIPIKTALLSVFDKKTLDYLAISLHKQGVLLYSTGGTQAYLEKLGIPVIPVEEITQYPSIFSGRVKTLHQKIFGGILYRRDYPADITQAHQYDIPAIDLVVVDLYNFVQTKLEGGTEEEIIEKIDIGGVSLIRAAAKNFKYTTVLVSNSQYNSFVDILVQQKGFLNLNQRKNYALVAFEQTTNYDKSIANYFGNISTPLRYGENPHQKAYFEGNLDEVFKKIYGKELFFNNLLDVDSAINLIDEFEEPTFAIIKHNNSCGLASSLSIFEAWLEALSCDPISVFGGVLIANRLIDTKTALEIHKIFFEVLIAPDFEPEALNILTQKKNRIILKRNHFNKPIQLVRTALNGFLVQEANILTDTFEKSEIVTKTKPNSVQLIDLFFASKISKHTKSNAIVLVKNKKLLALGTGQTSRVDALKQALNKAKHFNIDLKNSVMASDAFFPFADCVEIAHKEGITAIIQPGGSIRDKDSLLYCDANNISMIITGNRHFKH